MEPLFLGDDKGAIRSRGLWTAALDKTEELGRRDRPKADTGSTESCAPFPDADKSLHVGRSAAQAIAKPVDGNSVSRRRLDVG